MSSLAGKVALISGAAGGMGKVACRRFCEAGAAVIGTDIDADAGAELATELAGQDLRFRFVAADVARSADIDALARSVEEAEGALDILYNNAGIVLSKSLAETSEEEWDRVFDVNVKSIFLMTRAMAPLMRAGGSVVNVGSIGGIKAMDSLIAYGPAKAAVAQLSKVLAASLAPEIRVNAIVPGHTDTPMPRAFAGAAPDPGAVLQFMADDAVLGRMGRPEEVVDLALFLAADTAAFITGATITIDGGATLS